MLQQQYLTTRQAADKLGYSLQHTRLLIRSGSLAGEKIGRSWLIPLVAVQDILQRRRNLELIPNPRRGRPRRGITSESASIMNTENDQ
jgi:excisionase family DNA binding protein